MFTFVWSMIRLLMIDNFNMLISNLCDQHAPFSINSCDETTSSLDYGAHLTIAEANSIFCEAKHTKYPDDWDQYKRQK